MKTEAVNIRHESFDVYIGKAGRGQDGYFGNPFILSAGRSRGATFEKYKAYFCNRMEAVPEFRSRIHALKRKKPGCFCKPHLCHGDVIAEYLESMNQKV